MKRFRSTALVALLFITSSANAAAPTGLLCELLGHPEKTVIANPSPSIGWIVPTTADNDVQTAYEIVLSTEAGEQMWNTGKLASPRSIDIKYAGKPLIPHTRYAWKVRTWNRAGDASDFSAPQTFITADQFDESQIAHYPIETTDQPPARIIKKSPGHFFLDFARDAFGFLTLDIDSPDARELEIHLGEMADGESVVRNPPGSIRHAAVTLAIEPGRHTYRVQTPADKKNTADKAVHLPKELGVVLPFRYVEILNSPVDLDATSVRRTMLHYPFDDAASSFTCSDDRLNRVYDLCKYTIKATSAFGIYIDGNRERVPYEADAYINQLCHYCVDREYSLARVSHEYLLAHPTWPTEWKQTSILIAHADWMYTGNLDSLRRHYDILKSQKLLLDRARADGLLDTSSLKDVVDWPAGERDGYVMSPVNTVVNAFHHRTLVLMSEIADALDKRDDAADFRARAANLRESFNSKLFDATTGLYVDGENAPHSSLHANLFPLAFGLIPEDRKPRVLAFIKSKGMTCSVYAAQYLLEALFDAGEETYAIDLMTADTDRSWLRMLAAGSTITTEAWDVKYKPNEDWTHAWAAAPANIIPRYVLGIRPLTPGFEKILIAPQPGNLAHIEGIVPTVRGAVHIKFDAPKKLDLEIPANTTARVILPWSKFPAREIGAGRHVFTE